MVGKVSGGEGRERRGKERSGEREEEVEGDRRGEELKEEEGWGRGGRNGRGRGEARKGRMWGGWEEERGVGLRRVTGCSSPSAVSTWEASRHTATITHSPLPTYTSPTYFTLSP